MKGALKIFVFGESRVDHFMFGISSVWNNCRSTAFCCIIRDKTGHSGFVGDIFGIQKKKNPTAHELPDQLFQKNTPALSSLRYGFVPGVLCEKGHPKKRFTLAIGKDGKKFPHPRNQLIHISNSKGLGIFFGIVSGNSGGSTC